jgi:hypothetical protein
VAAVVGLVAVSLVGGCLALVGVGLDQAITHDLLGEDFAQDAGTFGTGRFGDVAWAVQDGAYVGTNVSGSTASGSSFASYARTAYVADTSVDVVDVEGAVGPGSQIGVGCADREGERGYVLLAGPDGSDVRIARLEGGRVSADSLDRATGLGLGTLRSLRLGCTPDPYGSDVELSGWVNGRSVLWTQDADGLGSYASMVLGLVDVPDGAVVRFDDAVAVVPGR